MAREFTAVIPVVPGREDSLRKTLAAFPAGEGSPFARVEGTHFARWVVAPMRSRTGGPLAGGAASLVLAAEFDHESATIYLEDLLARSPDETNAALEHCDGYPGATTARLIEWLFDHRVKPGFSENAIPGVLVSEVRDALALRKRVRDFVLRANELGPHELQAAWNDFTRRR